MRKVELKIKEQLKYETTKELVDHNVNKNRVTKNSIYQEDKLIVLSLFIIRKVKLDLSTAIEFISH